MFAPDVLFYDPTALYIDMLNAPAMAAEFAWRYACFELNLFIGWAEDQGRPDVAQLWKHHHLQDCDDPRLH
ncbi:hypothetical protein AB0A63_13805 [Lentzea sp. NPDC042327]|uniref:hypothetical protein n=1 Tax=Lentzea sp. NPDC042327 TaxID=3154801 RepID=UPI0033DEE856